MTHTDQFEEIVKEFEDRYVTVDHGPDADDHDCEPDKWNERFKMMSEADQLRELEGWIVYKLHHIRRETEKGMMEKVKDSIAYLYEHSDSGTYRSWNQGPDIEAYSCKGCNGEFISHWPKWEKPTDATFPHANNCKYIKMEKDIEPFFPHLESDNSTQK